MHPLATIIVIFQAKLFDIILWHFFVDAMDLDQTQAIYDLTEEEEEEQVESERDVKKEVNIFEES